MGKRAIYAGGLSDNMPDHQLRGLLGAYGAVASDYVARHQHNGKSVGDGFVEIGPANRPLKSSWHWRYGVRWQLSPALGEALRITQFAITSSVVKGGHMSRINLDPLMIFSDGSQLVISTQCSKEGDFSCTPYNAIVAPDDSAAFRLISDHLPASTCLSAQEYAYGHALRLFPNTTETMKKPPYLI